MGYAVAGTGSLAKRPYKGSYRWIGQIRYRGNGGVWKTKAKALTDAHGNAIVTAGGKSTKNVKAAREALAAWVASCRGAVYTGRDGVAEYVARDIEARRGAISDTTARGYLDYMPLFEPLSGVCMVDLRAKDVRAWVSGMVDAGKAPATVRKAFNILFQACERAVEVGDIHENPCTNQIRRQDLPRPARDVPNALDAEGVRRVNTLLDAAKNPRLRVGARLALHAGLRRGECCGLRWCDVDTESDVLHVRQSIGDRGTLAGDGSGHTYAKAPKSKAGTRDVPMTRALRADLDKWREEQREQWMRGDMAVLFSRCYVLGYADGSHFTPHALGRLWAKLAAGRHARSEEDGRRSGEGWEPGREPITGADGRRVTFHDLRHTFATVQVAAGADVKSVSALMGHADAAMTLNVYAAPDSDATRRAMAAAAPVLDAGSEAVSLRAV
ncbi:site-specific integrase [Olsenella umbonata]|uniref:Site-specific integrase n=1 Tax=Parafannyhessea umbonata TaxID=604330 RepID=A0A7X9T916_9ACTN|nr:site-specific integrase [Parafannyhessea umbonata]NMF25084.1 site-specific integrase [Parafannyhessea umbonata]